MIYASRDDLVKAYGANAVTRVSVRDEDPDGSQTVAAALAYASSLIDAQLSVRFALPLAIVPALLITLCAELAVPYMANTADQMTEQFQKRADQARADLEAIAKGRMNLGLPALNADDSPRPVLAQVTPGRSKLFTRDDLRGL